MTPYDRRVLADLATGNSARARAALAALKRIDQLEEAVAKLAKMNTALIDQRDRLRAEQEPERAS